MVEDNINLPVSLATPVKKDSAGIKPDRNISRGKSRSSTYEHRVLPCYRDSSIHSSNKGSNSRRLSTGNVDIVPHYMSAFTGSCHDLCKYGKKHSEIYSLHDKMPFIEKKMKPLENHSPSEARNHTMVKQTSFSKTLDAGSRRNRPSPMKNQYKIQRDGTNKLSTENGKIMLETEKNLEDVHDGNIMLSLQLLSVSSPESLSLSYSPSLSNDEENEVDTECADIEVNRNVMLETEKILLKHVHDGNIMLSLHLPSISSPESLSRSYSPSLSNDEEKEEEIECGESEADVLKSYNKEALNKDEVETVGKSQKKMILSKGKGSVYEDIDCSVVRLRFKRGTIVDGNEESCNIFNSGKVVLRHQDVLEKKEAQVLLNNMIEETVSKLVESKKSRVKALVGAFETVISLQ